jgi:hypothetical protein
MDEHEKAVRDAWARAVPKCMDLAEEIFDRSESNGEAILIAALALNSIALSTGVSLPHLIELVREVYHIGERIKGEMMQ